MHKKIIFTLSLVFLSACGGSGGDSSDGIVFEGELTQGAEDSHTARTKHGEGEGIEDVKICALGRCSTTDGTGMFGFSAPDSYTGGDVEFTISGHFTEAKVVVSVPTNAKDVFIHFEKHSSTEVIVHHLMIDGVRIDSDHADSDSHEEHDHEDDNHEGHSH